MSVHHWDTMVEVFNEHLGELGFEVTYKDGTIVFAQRDQTMHIPVDPYGFDARDIDMIIDQIEDRVINYSWREGGPPHV